MPLALAMVGLAGSVASAQLAITAIDDESTERESSGLEARRHSGSEPTGVEASSADRTQQPTTVPDRPVAADDQTEASNGETQIAVDCPPLFEVRFPLGGSVPLTDLGFSSAELAAWLADHPDTELLVEGHADAEGSEQANLQLSFRRAEATAAMIIEAGAAVDRVHARGFGEYQPLVGVPLDSDRNRRATMHVPGREECPIDDKEAAE